MSVSRRIRIIAVSILALPIMGVSGALCLAADHDVESMNAVELSTAAAAAMNAGNVQEAGYLFLASQARFQIDKQVYPPIGTGGDSPGTLLAALAATMQPAVLDPAKADPAIFASVIDRLIQWSPKFPPDYDPGWEFKNELDQGAAAKVVAEARARLLAPLQRQAKLLRNEEYRQLAKQLGDARAIEQRYMSALIESRNEKPVDEQLSEEFITTRASGQAAAVRMREIEWELIPESRWHHVVKWKAEEYYEDPQIIELCRAIERDDIFEMQRLIAEGAQVNIVGKQGMTLLLWAFPDRKIERFALLLKHGADPNVYFESDFGTKQKPLHPHPSGGQLTTDTGCRAGQTVTHLACRSPVFEYMELVFRHGGTATLEDIQTKEQPLDMVISRELSDRRRRVEILIQAMADLNRFCGYRQSYPVIQAAKLHDYETVLFLLQAGADYNATTPRNKETLVHYILRHEEYVPFQLAKQTADYQAVVKWLQEHGAEFEQARADLDRGGPWGKARKEQREREIEQYQKRKQVEAQQREEKLKAIKVAPVTEPTSAEDLVKSLSQQQRKQIELPTDPSTVVFSIHESQQIPAPGSLAWFTVYANGRVVSGSRLAPNATPVEAVLSQAELTWLLHLAVNECSILERASSDFENESARRGESFVVYEVAVKKGSKQLKIPQEALIVRPTRKRLGLDKFSTLSDFVTGLANRVHLGDRGQAILDAINAELAVKHPEVPSFELQHLRLAENHDNQQLMCTFEQELDLGDKRFEQVTGVYTASPGETPRIIVQTRNFSKYSPGPIRQ
jgi:ankyrin repeat protein